MTRDLLSFKDFTGGLHLSDPMVELPPNKTGRTLNVRSKNGSLIGLPTESGDWLDLSGLTFTHSTLGLTALGRIYGVRFIEGPNSSGLDEYLVIAAANALVALPVYRPSVVDFDDPDANLPYPRLGSVSSGYVLSESAFAAKTTIITSGQFMYIGNLFQWTIGFTGSANKVTVTPGVNTGPPVGTEPLAVFGARMWVRDTTRPLRLWFSNVEDLTNGFINTTGMWPTANFVDLPTISVAGNESVHTGIATADGLAVFTNKSVRLVYDSDNGFNTVVDPENGAFQGSLIQSGDLIYGLNQHGVFRTSGRLPLEYVTDDAMATWFASNSINWREGVTAAIYDGSYWVTFLPQSGHPDGSTTQLNRLTIEVDLLTGAIMWHGKPMDARWLVSVPRTEVSYSKNSSSPPKLLGIRADVSGGTNLGYPNAVLFHALRGNRGGPGETHTCEYTIPMMLEEQEFRVRRVTINGQDPAQTAFGLPIGSGGQSGRVMAELNPAHWWRMGESSILCLDAAPVPLGGALTMATTGSTPLATPGALVEADSCMTFNGTTDYATGSSAARLTESDFTISGWFKRDTDTGRIERIISNRTVEPTAYDTNASGGTAYWPMTSVTANGSSVETIAARNGTYGSTASATGFGLLAHTASALNVGGNVNGRMVVPYNAALNPSLNRIFGGWFSAANLTGTQILYDCINGFTGFRLWLNAGVPTLTVGTGAALVSVASSQGAITANRSYYIAFGNMTGAGCTLWVNQTPVGSAGTTFSANTVAASTFGCTVALASPFSGSLSNWGLRSSSYSVGTADQYALGRYGATKGWEISVNEDDFIEVFSTGLAGGSAVHVSADATTAIATGQWYHFALTFQTDPSANNANYGTLYLNGQPLTTVSIPNNAAMPTNAGYLYFAGNPTQLGGAGSSSAASIRGYLGGKLDEIAYFNRMLTGAEVAELYRASTVDAVWSARKMTVQMIDLLNPNWNGPTFNLTWKRGTWTADAPVDRGYARVSGFRARSLALRIKGYSGMRIDRVDVEVDRLSRRHP